MEEKAEAAHNAIGQANESIHWDGQEDRYAIYQINEDGPARKSLFMNYGFNQEHDNPVTGMDYHMVYSGVLKPEDSLNRLYVKFNIHHPENYSGHSLSVSDVVMIQKSGVTTAYYVNDIGFKVIPDFVKQRQQVYQANIMFVDTHSVNENSTGVEVEQHDGTWHTVKVQEFNGINFFLMEHDKYGREVLKVIVDGNGALAAQDLENGFDAKALEAIREYLVEQGIFVYDRRLMEFPEKEPEYPQVYRYTASYAKENGEMTEYRQSRKLNISCKERIEQLIRENFDGMYLAPGTVFPVIKEYGVERVSYVLAVTVQLHLHDGRFSVDNKAWAKTVDSFPDMRSIYDDARYDYCVNSHPAVLNGFINKVREILSKEERQD